jgi:hypothetical protein
LALGYAAREKSNTERGEMPRAKSEAAEQQVTPVIINQTVQPPAAQQEKERDKFDDVDFWTYIRNLSPQQWREHTCYLYRTKPAVGINQREKYLCIYQNAFTVDDIKKIYGGEEFHAILNRGNKAVKHQVFAIEAAPIYDTVRESPRQSDANAAITERLVSKALDASANANPATNAALEQVVEIMGKGFDAALARVNGAAGEKGDSEGGGAMKLVLAMMQSQTQILTTLIASMVKTQAAPAATDPSATLKTSLELFSALKDFAFDNGGGKRSSLWENLAERAIDKAPELIREVRGGVESIGRQRLELEHARRSGPTPVAPGAQQPAAMQPNPQPAPQIAAQPAPPQVTEDEAFERLAARHIVKMIYAGEPADMVMLFLRGANRKTFEMVMELNAAQLREVISADPILSQLLQYPELDAVIADITQFSAEEKAAALAEQDTEAARVQ